MSERGAGRALFGFSPPCSRSRSLSFVLRGTPVLLCCCRNGRQAVRRPLVRKQSLAQLLDSKLETRSKVAHTLHFPFHPLSHPSSIKAGTGHSKFECPAWCFAPLRTRNKREEAIVITFYRGVKYLLSYGVYPVLFSA